MSRAALLRLVAVGALLVALIVLPLVLPIQGPIRDFLNWVQGRGVLVGLVALALFWIPAALLLIPGSLITLAGGALFGPVEGTIAISLGSTAGACAAFLVGRTFARPWVERRIAANPRFQAIDQAVAAQGFKIVLLLRLSPVFPYNLLNYALALTRVSFRDYFLASWIGMLPGTIMYVYIGWTLGRLVALDPQRQRRPEEYVFLILGLVLIVVVTVYVTRLAKRALNQAIPDASMNSPPESAGGGHE
ncbi:MAG: TVP38/TMEM64 family protein [Gemmataceae bacterium]|nr:TVP38/TMEM64 family protein [Gemmataceae bacterium]